MSKKKIQAAFYSKQPLSTDDVQLIGWAGNHWDNISYFPKNYQIACVREGKGEIIMGEKLYPIHAGQFFLIHPKRIHSGKPDFEIGWQVDTIALKTEFVQSLFLDKNLPFFEPVVFENEVYKKLFDACFNLLNEGFQLNLENETRMLDMLFPLLTTPSRFSRDVPSVSLDFQALMPDSEAVNRAISYIETHYKTAFLLDDLIEKAYLSKFHLIRIFKKQTGLTPHAYQMQLKLNEARRLIFQDKSLTEIAYELGFSDQAHFTNTFKKYANGANPRDVLKTAISYNFEE
jgi:AraC-like DNA-binding protein